MSRVSGVGRIAGGIGGFVGAAGSTESVFGAYLAPGIALWAGDQIGTGGIEIWEGKFNSSIGAKLARWPLGDGTAGKAAGIAYDVLPDLGVGAARFFGWSQGTKYLTCSLRSPLIAEFRPVPSMFGFGGIKGVGLRSAFVENLDGFSILRLERPPRHHLFPEAFRDWFTARGIEIDKYTVELDWGTHSALHYGPNGGWWNQEIMTNLTDVERSLGRQLDPTEIFDVGGIVRRRAGIEGLPIVPYK